MTLKARLAAILAILALALGGGIAYADTGSDSGSSGDDMEQCDNSGTGSPCEEEDDDEGEDCDNSGSENACEEEDDEDEDDEDDEDDEEE